MCSGYLNKVGFSQKPAMLLLGNTFVHFIVSLDSASVSNFEASVLIKKGCQRPEMKNFNRNLIKRLNAFRALVLLRQLI